MAKPVVAAIAKGVVVVTAKIRLLTRIGLLTRLGRYCQK
jgi:hypothetical protein